VLDIVRILPYGAPIDQPAFGPTSGRALIEIYGGGFRVPTIAPPEQFNAPDVQPPQTVEVTFGGVPALSVKVPRSNLLRVITPPTPLPFDPTEIPLYPAEPDRDKVQKGHSGWVDVVVTNLDDNGAPIESETVSNGYAYVNPPLNGLASGAVSDTTLTRVVDALVNEFRRSVWPEVLTHQSVEYDSDGTELRIIDIARLPSITLLGPRTETSRQCELPAPGVYEPNIVPGTPPEERYMINRMPYALDLLFDVVGQARERATVLNLMHVATDFIQKTPQLVVQRDPSDPSRGNVRYQFEFETQASTFDIQTGANNSDLHSFRGSIRVKGVQIERIPIFGDAATDAVPEVEIIQLNLCPFI
jgi:hypothetical protein